MTQTFYIIATDKKRYYMGDSWDKRLEDYSPAWCDERDKAYRFDTLESAEHDRKVLEMQGCNDIHVEQY